MNIRSALVLLTLVLLQLRYGQFYMLNTQYGVKYNLRHTTWTSNSTNPPEGVQEINFDNVTVPDSSLELFAQLLDNAKYLNIYRCEMTGIYLPLGLLKLSITKPVKPIEIFVVPNGSYSLKAIEISYYDKLPIEIAHLLSLEHFYCRYTQIVQLDFELFARMENLTTFYMIETSTENILFPKSLRLPLIRSFILWGNHLTTLNATSWNLPSLEELDLSSNNFTELSKQIATLKNLTHLNLRNNSIKSIDMHMFKNMKRLTVLQIQRNQISSITGELQLPRLMQLRLERNSLVELDVSWWQLPALEYINLSDNLLKTVVGFRECFGGVKLMHLNGCRFDCSWMIGIGRSIRGMIIGYEKINSSWLYCYGNRYSMTDSSSVVVWVNGSLQKQPLPDTDLKLNSNTSNDTQQRVFQ